VVSSFAHKCVETRNPATPRLEPVTRTAEDVCEELRAGETAPRSRRRLEEIAFEGRFGRPRVRPGG
jgi:hypothetical protein